MQVEVTIQSAKKLKNVNWREGKLKPYAVVWIDYGPKCTTKVDHNRGKKPVWHEKLSIPLPPTSHLDTAVLYIDIVHANAAPGTKPLVGSVYLPLHEVLHEARAKGTVTVSLKIRRPSGRPQGKMEITIGMKDQTSRGFEQYGQPMYPYSPYMAAPPQPARYPNHGYGAPPVPVYESGCGTSAAKPKKENKNKYGMGTGLAVGAAAGLLGGLAIAGVELLEDKQAPQPNQVTVENVEYVNVVYVDDNNGGGSGGGYDDGGYDDGGYDDGGYDASGDY